MPDVLIVEDEEDILNLLQFSLRGADYSVRVARSGEDALGMVREKAPDLVLLDVMLPGMSGWDVCATIRSDAGAAQMPVVFLTARTSPDDLRRGLLAGGTAYLLKPFDPTTLRETVDRLVTRGTASP